MSSVSLTPTRKMVTPTGSNYVILSPHHLSSGASALSNASTPSSTVVPTTPVSSSPLCTTENILLTSNKGKNGGKKPKRPGAYSTANMRPSSVARRNARERNRVRQVNNGFTALRDHLPPVPEDEVEVEVQQKSSKDKDKDKKISKVETLKRAVDYIKSLQRLLDQHDAMCSPGATSTSGSVPGGCLSPPGSFYSPAGSDSPSSTTPNTGWTSQQATIGGPQGHFQQHQLYAPQSMEHGQHLQSLIPDQQQYIYHQQSTAYGHQQPMSNHSSMSSLSPGAFSEAGSPTPSMSSEGSSPVRSTRVKVEHQLDSFQDLQQLNTSYARSYDELTPLSPDDEELLDAIAWWQQN